MSFRLNGLLAITLAALAACGGNDQELACELHGQPSPPFAPEPAMCNNFTSTLVVKDRMGNVINRIPRREAVTIEYAITNNSTSAQSLTSFDGCAQSDLAVDSVPACTVFRTRDPNSACAAVAVQTTYAAGETRTVTATWQQTDLKGAQVPAGEFAATANNRTQCQFRLSFFEGRPFTVQ